MTTSHISRRYYSTRFFIKKQRDIDPASHRNQRSRSTERAKARRRR